MIAYTPIHGDPERYYDDQGQEWRMEKEGKNIYNVYKKRKLIFIMQGMVERFRFTEPGIEGLHKQFLQDNGDV